MHQVNFTNFSIQIKNANISKITRFFFSCWNNNEWSKFYVSLAITIIWDFLKQFSITMSVFGFHFLISTWKVLLPYFNQKDDWKTSKGTPQPKFFRTKALKNSKAILDLRSKPTLEVFIPVCPFVLVDRLMTTKWEENPVEGSYSVTRGVRSSLP